MLRTCLTHSVAERWNSATPGRGLKPTRDFPANPRRFPALAPAIWFGNPRFIDSKICGQNLQTRGGDRPCHRAGNVTAKDAKHTKRNPRHRRDTSRSTAPTGGNRGNSGSSPSLFSPLTPVQNATCSQRPGPRGAWIATGTRWPGSLQRMVERSRFAESEIAIRLVLITGLPSGNPSRSGRRQTI